MKGAVVLDFIEKYRPATMLELGGYVGYSTILFGDAVRRAGGKRYFSVEKNPMFAAVALKLVDLAGLRDTVRVVIGSAAESIQNLHSEGAFPNERVDAVFFDHDKPCYTADLKLCERLGLIGKGTLLIADNMIIPGNPEYEAYVRASVAEKRSMDSKAEEKGNPNLQYASRSITSYEPNGEEDALEITECMGLEA
jgi:catechol O-methyltransferase